MVAIRRRRIYERIRAGLQEAISHAKGEQKLKTTDFPPTPSKPANTSEATSELDSEDA
jgi:hypothetical protein